MVTQRKCSFCGKDLEPGSGKMYIKRDGTVYYFCSHKCQINKIQLNRDSRKFKWTNSYVKHKPST